LVFCRMGLVWLVVVGIVVLLRIHAILAIVARLMVLSTEVLDGVLSQVRSRSLRILDRAPYSNLHMLQRFSRTVSAWPSGDLEVLLLVRSIWIVIELIAMLEWVIRLPRRRRSVRSVVHLVTLVVLVV
jgi:hypothetical protein